MNEIICGDNRTVLPTLPTASIDLAYLDPPFNTGHDFGVWKDRFSRCRGITLVQHQDMERWPEHARVMFQALAAVYPMAVNSYLYEFGSTLLELRRTVQPRGSIWVHVDPRHEHLIRLVAEQLLAPAVWKSTVIWRYRRWPAPARKFQAMHDVLLWFAGPDHTFHELHGYEQLAESTQKTFGTKKQRADFSSGHRKPSVTSEETHGPPLSDVWEIGVIAPIGKERRCGGKYPTQKPEALLERVIRSTSNEGDTVLDPCCGSGTTLAVAHRLGRRWIGIDQSPEAVRIARGRMSLGPGRDPSLGAGMCR